MKSIILSFLRNPLAVTRFGGRKTDFGFHPNPADRIMHLPIQESILDLVVSIMDMPGHTVYSQRVAPGTYHAFVPISAHYAGSRFSKLENQPKAHA